MTLLYFNARSIRNKLTDLEIILNTGTYDLVFITETWLNETNPDSTITDSQNFGIIRNDRSTHGGGVAVIYNAKFADKIVVHPIDSTELIGFEMVSFDLYTTSHKTVHFICVYLPPKGSHNSDTVANLITVLKRFVVKNDVYVIGDFNFGEYKCDKSNAKSDYGAPLKKFILFLEKYNLKQLVGSPTHKDGNILDLVITSTPETVSSVTILDPLTDTCDHNQIEIKISTRPKIDNRRLSRLNFYSADYTKINSYLSDINWENILDTNENINQMYEKFLSIIHKSIELHVPINHRTQKPFLPKEIKLLLKAKRKLYIKSKTDSSLKAAYKEKAKLYKKAVANYRKSREEKVLYSNNKKVLFNHIKNKLHTRHFIPPLKLQSGKVCLDTQEKADALNSAFAEVFLQDQPQLHPPRLHTTSTFTTPHIIHTISHQEILNSIRLMKTSVSQTPDSIPSYFVKHTSAQLLQPLFIIFNHSIQTGQIPTIWKKAIVIPIYKKGNKNDPKNYRPISLTSVICRILEKIIHYSILSHLLSNQLISPAQHGFVYNRSTQTQQLLFLDNLTNMYDKKKQLDIIYLDFSKAFDKVSHIKLLQVLHHKRIHGTYVKWIENYLSDRSQTTLVDTFHSSSIHVSSGVPQGSVLGPLLFITYLDDLIQSIHLSCPHTNVYAYADDIKLLSTDFDDLQRALQIVDTWTGEWQLLLNKNKSEHLAIRNTAPNTFYIGNQEIPKVDSVRDLGITLTQDLTWKLYIEKIRKKSNILTHILLRTFTTSNYQFHVNLYKTYVRPIMEYNTCSWSPHLKGDIDEIEKVQRNFTSKLCKRFNIKYTDYNDRLRILNLDSLKIRRDKNDLYMLYKIINGLVDIDPSQLFTFSNFQGHNLRRHNFHIERKSIASSPTRRSFFSYRVIKQWNALPKTSVNAPTPTMFKNSLTSWTPCP